MSEEKADNKPLEKPSEAISQEVSQGNKQQECPPISTQIEWHEFAGKTEAGDQGISLKPLGSHDSDPFVSQDIVQSQPLPAQIVPTPVQTTTTPPPPTQTSSSDSEAGE